jgi:hypothetical protein
MTCSPCASTAIIDRPEWTELGYRRFRCRDGQRVFHERPGTPCHRLQSPTDIVSLVALWRYRSPLATTGATVSETLVHRTGRAGRG